MADSSRPTVVLADDHRIILDGLRGVLEQAGFELAGVAMNGVELVELAAKVRPDVIVADISMPLLNGIDAAHRIREAGVDSKIVFLTMHPDLTYLTRAFEAGALGYVLKHSASDELVTALRAALRGDRYVSEQLRHASLDELYDETKRHAKQTIELSLRRREVLQLLAEGKSAKEIGGILGISARTVETHKYKMMDELGVKSTAQLVQHAIRHGLIST